MTKGRKISLGIDLSTICIIFISYTLVETICLVVFLSCLILEIMLDVLYVSGLVIVVLFLCYSCLFTYSIVEE